LLGRWLASREINAVEHAELSAALLGDGDTSGSDLLREMLDRPSARAPAVLAAWRVAREAPPPAPGYSDRPPPSMHDGAVPILKTPVAAASPSATDWRAVPIAFFLGGPAGLVLASVPTAGPGAWIFTLLLCGLGVAAATWLARPLADRGFAQAAGWLGLSMLVLTLASAVTPRWQGEVFQGAFLLLGLTAGLAAWRLVAVPIDMASPHESSPPLGAFLRAAPAAGVATFVLLMIADTVLGPGLGHRVARYDGEISGAVLAAVLAAVAVPAALAAAAGMRRGSIVTPVPPR
jgi:hypothetical protein